MFSHISITDENISSSHRDGSLQMNNVNEEFTLLGSSTSSSFNQEQQQQQQQQQQSCSSSQLTSNQGIIFTLYSRVKLFFMECIYAYRMSNFTELPEFSPSDIFMFAARKYECEMGRSYRNEVSIGNEGNSRIEESDVLTSNINMATFEIFNHQNAYGEHSIEKDNNVNRTITFNRFLDDFRSLFWLSYRKDFPAIALSEYTSDLGWGCMLRSGQMLLAQAMSIHLLGPNWRQLRFDTDLGCRKLLKWFEDSPNAPFSVHNIAQKGLRYGKSIGEWFGPSTISQVLCDLVNQHHPELLTMYVSKDSVLYLDEISDLCTSKTYGFLEETDFSTWLPLMILIPMRLGLENLNEIYIPSLKELFLFPQSVGILGGRPQAAAYFVAWQDDYIFYLDPHILQPAVLMNEPDFPMDSFHCPIPRKMQISSMDPSLAIGFYCRDRKDFEDFWDRAEKFSQQEHPFFTLEKHVPDYHLDDLQSFDDFEEDMVIL